MAMGGTGVAIANPATAPFFNPAVLSMEKRERFAVDVPTLGVRVFDPEDFLNQISSFQDLRRRAEGLLDQLPRVLGRTHESLHNIASQ